MKWSFACEYVRCGKDACTRCPHGPYWYGYCRVGPRVHKRYFGKLDPRERTEAHPWDAIFLGQTASERLACEILGIDPATAAGPARSAYLKLTLATHPDAGGSDQESAWVSAAWTWLKARRGW